VAASRDNEIEIHRRLRELDAGVKSLFRELPAGRELATKWNEMCVEMAHLKLQLQASARPVACE
jgi:hypothetical protein